MSKYHHTTIKRRPSHSNPDDASPVAEVVFEAENPHTVTLFILDALDALGTPSASRASRMNKVTVCGFSASNTTSATGLASSGFECDGRRLMVVWWYLLMMCGVRLTRIRRKFVI